MEEATVKHYNRLIGEKSPYLLQHSGNPVDWYPWGEDALRKAEKEDKPLLISIGYSSCHWCHVMERESFEDAETARVMNGHFVNIKVDREERPDIDSLYMKAVQAMTGHGGWPLTVFATPEGVPFFGGTYFPPEDTHGLPSFRKVLTSVSEAYRNNKGRIGAIKDDLVSGLSSAPPGSPLMLTKEIPDKAFQASLLFFDPVYGGFGETTKFPHAMFLKFLLKYHKRTREERAMGILKKSLSAMAEGGVYDHLGGGFHRYSVDEAWEVPHFEKMLYDNALLLELYALAYEETGTPFYGDVAIETAAYLINSMRGEKERGGGGFYSAEDADVGDREGEFYLWTPGEIISALGEEDGKRFIEYFSVTEEGNFEGKNTLRISSRARAHEEPIGEEIKAMKKRLLGIRAARTPPLIDRKVITGWNGLAVLALTAAGKALKRDDFTKAASECAEFILKSVKGPSGRLSRYWLDGRAGAKGALEDYSLLGNSLLSLHGVTGEKAWLKEARTIADSMIDLFYEKDTGIFYDTGRDQDGLFVRERDLFDNDVPSGNSAAADFLLNAAGVTNKKLYEELSLNILRSAEGMAEEPMGHGNFLSVLETYLKETQS